eukprot:m.307346 g.307346  ORF g.307346 m.307346 type:complete len:72 (-) comp16361_c0_seq8:1226-1441(-)
MYTRTKSQQNLPDKTCSLLMHFTGVLKLNTHALSLLGARARSDPIARIAKPIADLLDFDTCVHCELSFFLI